MAEIRAAVLILPTFVGTTEVNLGGPSAGRKWKVALASVDATVYLPPGVIQASLSFRRGGPGGPRMKVGFVELATGEAKRFGVEGLVLTPSDSLLAEFSLGDGGNVGVWGYDLPFP